MGALVLCAALLAAPSAQAAFGIFSFDARVTSSDEGDHYEPAGGHPHFGITDIRFNTTDDETPDGNVEDLRVDVPPGLVSNPQALPQCTDLERTTTGCPPRTQLGTEELEVVVDGVFLRLKVPFYNMTFDDTQVSRFGFNPEKAGDALGPLPTEVVTALGALAPVDIIGGVRWESDYGVYFTISDTAASPEVISSKLKFFGVPASDAHNAERGEACVGAEIPLLDPLPPITVPYGCDSGGQLSDADEVPFLTNPTRCLEQKLTTRLTAWSHAGEIAEAFSQTVTRDLGGEGPSNCDQLPFAPTISLTPDTTEPDSPTGPEFELHVPPDGLLSPGQLSTSHVEDASLTLPPGLTLNPSAANGLEACPDAGLALGTRDPVDCPAASQIGTVAVDTPLLPTPLEGAMYVGQPLPGDQYRVFLTADGNGVSVRLKGSARPDPATGQLTVVFEDNPQQAFEDISLDVRDGSRAPLATPVDCGQKTATSLLKPYSGTPSVSPSSSFEIAGPGCPPAFEPGFAARTANPVSGAFAPFHADIARADRNQFLSGVRVDTPPGLGAMISRVERCPDAVAATGACPAGSRIGTVGTRSGAGSEPFALSGPVYFTEGYKGAPFGMVAVIRAIAGPYDLGTVIVRQQVHVDPNDAHVTVVSDPLPQILEGVPIRLRDVAVAIDRDGFVYNPTSCGERQVGATLHSAQGTASARTAGVRFDGCEALSFAPRLTMKLTGARQTKLGKHPALSTTVTQGGRQANIGSARVVLPLSLALDPNNAQAICGFEAGLRADCPAKSQIGTASAVSPALERKLSGPVYFVQGIRIDPTTGNRIRTLPSLLVKLNGEVRINLRGTTAIERDRLVSTFERIPDAPVSRFDLKLKGGKGGILAVAARKGLCGRRQREIAQATFSGQNAKRSAFAVTMPKPCRRPGLKIKRVRLRGDRLVVRGTLAKAARLRPRAILRCGKARTKARARRVAPTRWRVRLSLARCADARRARLRVVYPGGGKFATATRKRSVRLG